MICILVSLKREINLLLDRLENISRERYLKCTIYDGKFKDRDIRVIKTGIAHRESELPGMENCSLVISTGFCGALSSDLKSGDVIVPSEITFAGKGLLDSIVEGRTGKNHLNRTAVLKLPSIEEEYGNVLSHLKTEGVRAHTGRTVTTDRIIRSFEEKMKLNAYFQALAVDMEDFFRAGMALKLGIGVLCVRAVLDELRDNVPPVKEGFYPFSKKVSLLLEKLPAAQKSIFHVLEKIVSLLS